MVGAGKGIGQQGKETTSDAGIFSPETPCPCSLVCQVEPGICLSLSLSVPGSVHTAQLIVSDSPGTLPDFII